MVDCIEENAYNTNEIFVSNQDHFKFNPIYKNNKIVELFSETSNESIKLKSYYFNGYIGIVNSLEFQPEIIATKFHVDPAAGVISKDSTLQLYLNNNITYTLQFTDSRLMINSFRPDTFPRLYMKIGKGTQNRLFYLKVCNYFTQPSAFLVSIFKAIKHENINRPKSPCVEDNQYNFEFCVEKHIVMKAGCQPYWNKLNMKGIQICKNGSMLNHYSNERTTISLMSRKELIETTKCLMPCSFMEYKVSVCIIHLLNKTILFLAAKAAQ